MARIIAYLICGGFSVMMLYVGLTQLVMQRRLLANPQRVDATIVRSEVVSKKSSDTDNRPLRDNSTWTHSPEVRFRYALGGREYESELMYPTIIGQSYGSRDGAAEVLAPYPLNAKVQAFVNPSLPEKAYLIPEAGAGPKVFIAVGLVLIPIGYFVGKIV